MKRFLMLVLIGVSTITSAKAIHKRYKAITKDELIEDYRIFREIFEKANAGLYKYHLKESIDSSFDINFNRITDQTTYREFFTLVWNTIDYSGSCHNTLSYPDKILRDLLGERIYFPLPLKCLGDDLYTNVSHEKIPLGSEIISVNGIEKDEFLERAACFVSTDGHNMTGKYGFVETSFFSFNTYLAFGKFDEYKIMYRSNGKIETEVLPAIHYPDFYKVYKEKHSRKFLNRIKEDYKFEYVDSLKTGILTIQTFVLGGPRSEEHQVYKSFLDSVFTFMKDVPHLIVDIRGNGGGQDPNDILLYSYLTQREFRENTTAFTSFNKIPLSKYYVKESLFEKRNLRKELMSEHSELTSGKYYQHERFNPVWKPNEHAYQGKIVLLIDPFVASAASLFGALVKSDENTTVIGEESCGTYYGHTGHIPVTYQLPNTQLLVSFSIVDIEQDVVIRDDQKKGDGIMPDIEIIQSHQHFLEGKDTQMRGAFEFIRSIQQQ